MENGTTQADLLRLVGVMTVLVGMAWAVQVLGFSHDATLSARLMWTLAAAAISGAGVGLVVTAQSVEPAEAVSARA